MTADERAAQDRVAGADGVLESDQPTNALLEELRDGQRWPPSPAERRAALDAIRAMRGGPYLTPQELNEIFDSRHDEEVEKVLRGLGR